MSIAYKGGTDLAVKTGVLRSSADKYSAIAKNLDDLVQQVDNCLTDLKNDGWTTPAGSAFHEMVNTKWSENIKKYTDLLNTLSQILRDASKSYEELVENCIRKTKVDI